MAIFHSDLNQIPTLHNLREIKSDMEKHVLQLEQKMDRAISLILSMMGEESIATKESFAPEDVARLLQLHPSTVRRWLRDEGHPLTGLQPQGCKGAWIIRRSDLEAFIGCPLHSFRPAQ